MIRPALFRLTPIARAAAIAVALATFAHGAALAQTVPAQAGPTGPGPSHSVRLFNRLCISKLPDIDAIATIARSQNFVPVTGEALKPYQPQVPAALLRVWRFEERGARFTLVVAKSRPDAQFNASHPDFAGSTNYACSLIPAGRIPAAETNAALAKLIGRKADERFEQGPLAVHAWLARSETTMVQAFHYAAKSGGTTRLLSATIFVKK